jgi:hypothetical protein
LGQRGVHRGLLRVGDGALSMTALSPPSPVSVLCRAEIDLKRCETRRGIAGRNSRSAQPCDGRQKQLKHEGRP